MAARMNHVPRTFDEAKLVSMVEPLTINIVEIIGSAASPIQIPEGEDGQPGGVNWDKDGVRRIEQWLVSQWSGGGMYEITVTDSASPPQVMKWRPFWDKREYPKLVASPQDPNIRIPVAQPATPQQQVSRMAFPQGIPSFQPQAGFSQGYPQQQQFYQPPPLPGPPAVGTPAFTSWQGEVERREREDRARRTEDELRQLREEKARTEREALNARHQTELRAAEQANERRFSTQDQHLAELRNMIASLTQAIQNGPASKVNPEIEALKESNRQLAERHERERQDREAERRDRETRELIKAQQELGQRQFDELRRQHEDTVRRMTEGQNRHDPLLTMMQEQSRQQAEAMKELARQQSAQLDKIQLFMMNPRDMMLMAKESRGEIGAETDRIARMYSGMIETQQKFTENLLQLQPGGGGALDLVRDGVNGVKEIAERYMGQKAVEARVNTQAQVQVAEAQSRAIVAQAAAQSGQPVPVPPPPHVPTHLAGPQTNGTTNGTKKKGKKLPVAVEETAEVKAPSTTKRLGKTDMEWFGPIISEVEILREGVNHFIESCGVVPPRLNPKGEIDGISPLNAAMGVMQAVQLVMAKQIPIPVMIDLLFQDRFADFVDVLVPDAPQNYRDDLTQILVAQTNALKAGAKGAEDDEGDEDDEDDDGEETDALTDSDDGNDGVVVPMKPTGNPAKPAVTH